MKLILVTASGQFFGQARKPWVSIDTAKLIRNLQERGFEVELLEFHQLAAQAHTLRNEVIFYTYSQLDYLRGYIKDIMLVVSRANRIIPSLELLLCHENKGFAELYKRSLGLSEPQAWYLSHSRELAGLQIHYPVVLKTTSGTNAKGVFLCEDESELRKRLKTLAKPVSLAARLDSQRRRYLRPGRKYQGYPDFNPVKDADQWLEYMRPGSCFVLQEFIPGLDCDYRVIAVQERFYVMKRLTLRGDFRASGTKHFVFEFTVPEGLLDFAADVYHRFDTPYLSMDIGHKEGRNHLFEYQALHFGTAAIVRSTGYYQRVVANWEFVETGSGLEETLAYGLAAYLGKQA